ncbi:MAG: hypothetical protein SFY67_06980 [Candidatus Melainabacteria bacterium]|nr:hypothetical protein [Candidatus Melainabacteria bacterium]
MTNQVDAPAAPAKDVAADNSEPLSFDPQSSLRSMLTMDALGITPYKSDNAEGTQIARLGDRRTDAAPDRGDRPIQTNSPELTRFAQANELDVSRAPNGQLEFSVKANGERRVLMQFDPTIRGLESAQEQLKKMTDGKIAEIKERFGVDIARAGDKTPPQQIHRPDGQVRIGKPLEARDPTYRELLGIESALNVSEPGQKPLDGRPAIKFYFPAKEPYVKGAQARGTYEAEAGGRPAIVWEPGALKDLPTAEADSTCRCGSNEHHGIQGITTHEVAHNSEVNIHKIFGEDFVNQLMGWTKTMVKAPDGQMYPEWSVKGRNGETMTPAADTLTSRNPKWTVRDANGKITGRISSEEVMKRALIRPATNYLDSPSEMLAEGLTMLRLGGEQRESFMKNSPYFYDSIKSFDQAEMDNMLGKDKFMRNFDGRMVPKTPENLEALKVREEEARKRLGIR